MRVCVAPSPRPSRSWTRSKKSRGPSLNAVPRPLAVAMPTQVKRKARLLVVDDDPGLLRLLTIRLRAENYEVDAVESAAAALAALGRVRPDLVITDLRMDQMDGIGLLKEIQSRAPGLRVRSEERRVGKGCRSRWYL